MTPTYTQIHIHVVLSVEGRQQLIRPEMREELQRYITGIIQTRQHKVLAIFCMPDHSHILIGLRREQALSDLVQAIQAGSSDFVARRRWFLGRFRWQESFAAFSYGHSQIGTVIRYILNQEKHHKKRSFRDEYLTLLERFGIPHTEGGR